PACGDSFLYNRGGRITNLIGNAKLVIFCAVEFEAKALRNRLDCDIRTIGIRATRLPAELASASVIVMAGLAGALDPSLKVGDVVIDELSDEIGVNLQY